MHGPSGFVVLVDEVEPLVVDVGAVSVDGGLTVVVGQQISLQMLTKGSKGNEGNGPVWALHGKQISGFGPIRVKTRTGA